MDNTVNNSNVELIANSLRIEGGKLYIKIQRLIPYSLCYKNSKELTYFNYSKILEVEKQIDNTELNSVKLLTKSINNSREDLQSKIKEELESTTKPQVATFSTGNLPLLLFFLIVLFVILAIFSYELLKLLI
jgi:hypothetical protein